MKKLFFLPILLFTLLLGGCVKNKTVSASAASSSIDTSASSQLSFNSISDSQDGVDITVENIRRENGKTIVELYLNNHRYNLADMTAEKWSNFSGVKPSKYIIKSSVMGGHHVQAEMIFDQELSGPLVIGLSDSLIFNFNIQ